jgi:predicted phosphodiesterase
MKVAVLSDIHGFSISFDRVLADIANEPDLDRIVIAGDLCEGGPDPKGVLERIAALDAVVLQGNTDRDVAEGYRESDGAQFTASELGDDGLRYLRNLRFSERITPPGGASPDDDLLVVHANPLDQDRHVPPDASPRELRELLGETRAAVIAFGHLHIAYIRELPDMTLIDVSAVGNPKDGDLRSKWGLLAWDETAKRWSVELRFVDYALEETEAQIRASGLPNPESAIRKLRKASYS